MTKYHDGLEWVLVLPELWGGNQNPSPGFNRKYTGNPADGLIRLGYGESQFQVLKHYGEQETRYREVYFHWKPRGEMNIVGDPRIGIALCTNSKIPY
jgi:hypothetical protein